MIKVVRAEQSSILWCIMQTAKDTENPLKNLFHGHILAIEINDFFPRVGSAKTRSRVIPNILHLLDHIDKHRSQGNFFITPDLMRDFPEVVSLVFSRGHEIGICCNATQPGSVEQVYRARESLVKLSAGPANGVMLKSTGAQGRSHLTTLAHAGFSYCLVDFKMSMKGSARLPIAITYNSGQSINVYPPSLYRFLGIDLMFGMPGKIRLYPYWFLRKCVRQFTYNRVPAIINFPLWEFDPHLPRTVLSPLQSLKSYGNLSLAEFKLTRLLLDFDFAGISTILELEGSGNC